MLFGLSIDGKAVNGWVNQDNTICEELLGVSLFKQGTRGQGINLHLLRKYHNSIVITENSTEQENFVKSRCYIMILFGHFLFPEIMGNTVNIMYLPLLRQFYKINTYSWGSAVLAHLIVPCVKMHRMVVVLSILTPFCSRHGAGRECRHSPLATQGHSSSPFLQSRITKL